MVEPSKPRDLLVVFNRIGDLTISTPLFRALARDRSLSLVTRPFGRPLLRDQPYVDEVYTLDTPNRGRGLLGKAVLGGHRRALGRRLAEVDFDRVLLYEVERNVIRDWL
jgi:ADP-heptose:LPS heptosyltransferase